jgi:hypothetical protein
MSLKSDLKHKLRNHGADFIHFVDISQLSDKQNRNYPNAILIGIILSPNYIQEITNTPDYVQTMIQNDQLNNDEFHLKEIKTDRLADYKADYLSSKGYSAYSQSEDNIYSTGFYNEKTKSTPLPHKTIAGLAGLGWIGGAIRHSISINGKQKAARVYFFAKTRIDGIFCIFAYKLNAK